MKEIEEKSYQELIQTGKIDTDKMSHNEIEEVLIERAGNKLLEKINHKLLEEELEWIENATEFALRQKRLNIMNELQTCSQ